MDKTARVFVAGGETLIGRAIVAALARHGHGDVLAPGDDECPLTDAALVGRFFATHEPEYVIVAAGKSGGIEANRRQPADLMLDNLLTASHLCAAAARQGVRKLLYLGSSCCYPKACAQPMRVADLGTGPLEPTSAAYATAKIAGMQLCHALRRQYGAPFVVGIPADVFGPYSTFDGTHSHVIPSLIQRMHAAKVAGDRSIELWGTGTPRREFLFADDLAEACLVVMARYDAEEPINLGGGTESSIREAATAIAEVVGYDGNLRFDTSRPDGAPRKLLDSSVLSSLGWRAGTTFREALAITYRAFLERLPG